ncbi:MAG: FG-GAP repeat domain-containing protein [Thermodesulfobacteriota bacterium]
MVPPCEVKIEVETSKWVLPGGYELVVRARGRVCSREVSVVLDVEGNPALSPGVVTVPGAGVPLVRVYGVDGVLRGEFLAFGRGHGGGLAAGDIDGNGLYEVVVGTVGRGGRALLGVFGVGGESLGAVEVAHGDRRGAISVACGDLDGDWIDEVVVGSYEPSRRGGGGGVMRVYKFVGAGFVERGVELYPYGGYRKAPQVAVGDLDGDGRGELLVLPGGDRRGPAHVKVYGVDTGSGLGRWSAHQVMEMVVDSGGYGATVASCDMDGDGRDEILLGAGPGPKRGAQVVVIGSGDEGLYIRGGSRRIRVGGMGLRYRAAIRTETGWPRS